MRQRRTKEQMLCDSMDDKIDELGDYYIGRDGYIGVGRGTDYKSNEPVYVFYVRESRIRVPRNIDGIKTRKEVTDDAVSAMDW